MKKQIILLILCLFSLNIYAQETIEDDNTTQRINYNSSYLTQLYQKNLFSLNNDFHTAIKPYRGIDLVEFISPEAVKDYYNDLPSSKKLHKLLFHRDLVKYSGDYKGNFYDIRLNPIMDFEFLSESQESDLGTPYRNTRGVQILGQLGERFSFGADIRENLINLPTYARLESERRHLVVPGMGRPNIYLNSEFDFSTSSGYFQYRSKSFFTFELGTGKNFIGEGHRSLLLSDNAVNYPYLKIQTDIGKIRYQNIYTKMLDLSLTNGDDLHKVKYSAMHYLSLNLGKRWNLGVFEAVTWDGETNSDGKEDRGFELAYLNPIIFYRSVEHAIGSAGGNVLMGSNFSFKASDNTMLYGQFILDEFKISAIKANNGSWENKFGFQAGIKTFDFLKVRNLNLLGEMNLVRPFVYAHKTGKTNYGHYNQELAHPLGSNFVEFLAKGSYQYKRFLINGHLMLAIKGYEINGINNGSDVYHTYDDRPGDIGYTFLNLKKATTIYGKGTVGYIINPSYNLILEAGLGIRSFTPETETTDFTKTNTTFISFGLKTNLFKHYYDF